MKKKKGPIEPKCKNCLSGDTLIINDGIVRRIDEIIPFSKTFVNGNWCEITAWKNSGKCESIKITTTLGLELKLTPNHLVSTPNGWVQAINLKINDEIVTLKNYPESTNNLINEDDALLIGAITGDGWQCRCKKKNNKILIGIGFGFSANKLQAWQPMLNYAAKKFNSKEKLHLVKRVKKPFLRIDWRNKAAEEFQNLINKQRIPEVIWRSSQKIWGAYLSGLFSTDGCLSCVYKKNTTQIQVLFFQSTESIIREIQIMLRMMGIYSYLKYKKRPPHKDLWILTIGRINSLLSFQQKVGFVDKERKIKLQEAIVNSQKLPSNSRYSTRRRVNEIERVKKIESIGEIDVYDISVPTTESFYANCILVHNCLLYDRKKGVCKVAILINGEQIHLPVFPEDHCHMDQLGIPVEQVRWWVEDPKTGKPTDSNGIVKIEYPDNFFGIKKQEQ